MRNVNVLAIVGDGGGSIDRELAQVAADSSSSGIALELFGSLTDVPWYSDAFEDTGTPSTVGALRAAAVEADAVLIVANYHGRVSAVVHNAIDWLTHRWDQAMLHDKPLAVIGRASGCYSGVWSHQTDNAHRIAGPVVIESITVSNLREAINKLAGEVRAPATRDERQAGQLLLINYGDKRTNAVQGNCRDCRRDLGDRDGNDRCG
jgi:NAD(P)H-dependent FMN reductase